MDDEALEEDAFAQVASAGLRRRKVAMRTHTDFERRTALATVATCRSSGENQIIVAAGANAALTAAQFEEQSAALASGRADPTRPWAVILQGEVPPEANWEVAAKAHAAGAFVLLNNGACVRMCVRACVRRPTNQLVSRCVPPKPSTLAQPPLKRSSALTRASFSLARTRAASSCASGRA